MGKKLLEMKVAYRYVEPKTEEEKKDRQEKLDRAYDILFSATLEKLKHKGKKVSF